MAVVVYGFHCVLLSDLRKETGLGSTELHFLDYLACSCFYFCPSVFFHIMDDLKIHNNF